MKRRRKTTYRRKRADLSASRLCSAITNGSHVLNGVDHRSATMRRFRDLIALHTSDLGGEDACSASEKSLIRRAAMLTLQLELLELRIAQSDGAEATQAQLQDYQRATSALRRLLETLGLQRRARDVESLDQYLARKRRRKQRFDDNVIDAEAAE